MVRGLAVAAPWRADLASRLDAGEAVLAWLDLDLDARLHYGAGLVVLTEQRLLARHPDASLWRSWPLTADMSLQHRDHAGVGTLELHDDSGLVASWRYTLGRHPLALRLVQRFEQQREALRGVVVEPEVEDSCERCGAPLLPGKEDCVFCSDEPETTASTWTLFRLWRFARPYRKELLTTGTGIGTGIEKGIARSVPSLSLSLSLSQPPPDGA